MARGAERRREKRYETELSAMAEFDGAASPVTVSDISPSGALLTGHAGAPFAAGSVIAILLEQFGRIEARVVHAGQGFYGVQFVDSHLHRDRLNEWLRSEAESA